MRRAIPALLLLAGAAIAGDLFENNGAFTPVISRDNVDVARCLAYPGKVPLKLGVVRIERRGHNHHGWDTQATAEPTACQYSIAFKKPVAVGTVLFVGPYDVSFLRPGAVDDPNIDANWTKVRYPGEARRQVRIVPCPKGTMTSAIRLSAPGSMNQSGRFQRSLSLAIAFAGRYVNITPMAELRVSSNIQPRSGFRPDPRQSNPETLVDGSLGNRNWSSAQRAKAITPDKPETILLDWHKAQTMRGCMFLIGTSESGAGTIIVQEFVGAGDPDETVDKQWRTITQIKPHHPWRPPLCWEAVADFGKDVTTRALRFVMPAGLPKAQAAGGEGANLNAVSFGEIVVFQDLHEAAPPRKIARRKDLPDGVIPITFKMPAKGKATIRLVNRKGEIVKNLVNGVAFEAGKQTVWWDLATIDDFWPPFQGYQHGRKPVSNARRIALPGKYRWEGIWHPGITLEYLYSYYPLKKHGLAWITADTTGGWLADHAAPQTVVRVGDRMWVGTFCEAGHALLESDLDMKKLWGSNRIWLACPRVMAASGDKIYYLEEGGWARKIIMIEVDTKTKRTRRLLGRDKAKDEKVNIQGLAVVGTRAFFSEMAKNEVTVVDMAANLKARPAGFGWNIAWKLLDHEKMKVERTLKITKPSRIRPYDEKHLAIVSDKSVLLLNTDDYTTKPLITGLTNPRGLAIDAGKSVYVGEMKPVHQVKVFNKAGRLVRTFGKPGPHKIGAFDPDNLESPTAVEVDAKGNVWVCELNHELKRTSVWDQAGKCINQVLGPTVYGGGGDIDPRNENRFFYKGKEFIRNPKTGETKLTRIIWRGDNKDYDLFFTGAAHNFGGASPAYPFYHRGRLFFTSWQGWAAGGNTTLWVYDQDRVRPVAAIGSVPDWLRKRLEGKPSDPKFGHKVAERAEEKIDFDWGGSAPMKGVRQDNFAARFTAKLLVPKDGNYTFFTTSDDGVRLFIDNKQVLANWTDHGSTVDKGEVELTGGEHELRLEFYERHGGARIRLEWQGPEIGRQVIAPAAFKNLKTAFYHAGHDKSICAWTDRNDDGKVQKREVRLGRILYDGQSWDRCGATWQFRMNHKFEAAVSDGNYGASGLAFFRVEKLSVKGYPIYRLPTEFKLLPYQNMRHASDAVFTDRHGNAITLDEYVVSMKPDGAVNWRYKNRWPGLHSGHNTTARGDEPGVLIAPTRFLGSGYVNKTIGEVICIGSNLGATYLMSEKGFYIDKAFQDTRAGLAWRMNAPPSPTVLAKMSLGDEHFGGTLSKVMGDDGKYHFRFVVGQPHCSVVELHGLEKVRKLRGRSVTVTAEHLKQAEELRQLRALKTLQRKEYSIKRMANVVIDGKANEWPKERIDGFALAYDDQNLYVLFSGKDDRAPFKNATTDNFLEAFKKGDVVDVKLETRAGNNAKRTAGAAGDIRLSFAEVQGRPAAILYDFVVPGTPRHARLSFSSPWRTVYIDRVTILPDVKIAVTRGHNNFTLEASVPLNSIHLDPRKTPIVRGDVGRVLSDQTGTRSVDRIYWSNKNTKIMADVPSEARIQPSLWGKLRFE